MDLREKVVEEALTWVRTPYHHRARVKGHGVDCAQFPLAVYAACGVIPDVDVGHYSQYWFHHRSEEVYLGWVVQLGGVETEREPLPADFLVYRFGRCFAHGVIVVDSSHGVHSDSYAGMVCLCELGQGPLAARPFKLFEVVR